MNQFIVTKYFLSSLNKKQTVNQASDAPTTLTLTEDVCSTTVEGRFDSGGGIEAEQKKENRLANCNLEC